MVKGYHLPIPMNKSLQRTNALMKSESGIIPKTAMTSLERQLEEQLIAKLLDLKYEYFLGKFAASDGKLGGEFYTPRSVVCVLAEMLEPYAGRVYDPCCGSGGMFVQSEKFVEAHGGNRTDVSVFGQESDPTIWRLAHMNLAIHGIEANLSPAPGASSTGLASSTAPPRSPRGDSVDRDNLRIGDRRYQTIWL
jgi:type I restriction-modification system DNA methylase subunit